MTSHRTSPRSFLRVIIAALSLACEQRAPDSQAQAEPACNAPGVRELVEQFGQRLELVSLQTHDSIVRRAIEQHYAPFVTADLIDAWVAEPASAPGRLVSSPWPERIEVRSIEAADAGSCRVEGEVVHVTSVELAQGGVASREPVTLRVRQDGGRWRISAYETAASSATDAASADASEAADVIRRYYAAINAGDFRRAYALWGDSGRASGQTFDEFATGYRETARVDVDVGEPGRVDPAAGSRYIEIPVVIRAVTDTGVEQRFEGTYVLRRAVVEGATPAQRRWHIHSAEIRGGPVASKADPGRRVRSVFSAVVSVVQGPWGSVLRAMAEIETSLVTYGKAREGLLLLDEAAAASERAAELARLRFAEGASDFLQVLDAERTLLDAQDRRALGRTTAANALVDVYRALGGAWPLASSTPTPARGAGR